MRVNCTGVVPFIPNPTQVRSSSKRNANVNEGLAFMEGMLGRWGDCRPGPAAHLLVRLINDSGCLGFGRRRLVLVEQAEGFPEKPGANKVYVMRSQDNRFTPWLKEGVAPTPPLPGRHDPESDGLLAAAYAGFEGVDGPDVPANKLIDLRVFLWGYLNQHRQEYARYLINIVINEKQVVESERRGLKWKGWDDFEADKPDQDWQPQDLSVWKNELIRTQLTSAGKLCPPLPEVSWKGRFCQLNLLGASLGLGGPPLPALRIGSEPGSVAAPSPQGQANNATAPASWGSFASSIWQGLQRGYNATYQFAAHVNQRFSFPVMGAAETVNEPAGVAPIAQVFNSSAVWQEAMAGAAGAFLKLSDYIKQPAPAGARQSRALPVPKAPSASQPQTPRLMSVPLVKAPFNSTRPAPQAAAMALLETAIADQEKLLQARRSTAPVRPPEAGSADNWIGHLNHMARLLQGARPGFEDFLNALLTQWRQTQGDSFVLALCGNRTLAGLFEVLSPRLNTQTLAQARPLIERQITQWLPPALDESVRVALCKAGIEELGTPFGRLSPDSQARIQWNSDEHLMLRLSAQVAQAGEVELEGAELPAMAHLLTSQALARNQTGGFISAIVLDWAQITGRFANLSHPAQWQAAGQTWLEEFQNRPAQQVSAQLSDLMRSLSEPPPNFDDMCAAWAQQLSGGPQISYKVWRSTLTPHAASSSVHEKRGSLADAFKDAETRYVEVKIETGRSPWGPRDTWVTLNGTQVLKDYEAKLKTYEQQVRAGVPAAVTLLLRRDLGQAQLQALLVPQSRVLDNTYAANKGCVLLAQRNGTSFPYAATFVSGRRIENLTPIEFTEAEKQTWGLTDIQSQVAHYVSQHLSDFFDRVTAQMTFSTLARHNGTEDVLYGRLYQITGLDRYVEKELEGAKQALNVKTPWELVRGFLPGASCFAGIPQALAADRPAGAEDFLAGIFCGIDLLNFVPLVPAGAKLTSAGAKFLQQPIKILLSQGGYQAAKAFFSSPTAGLGKKFVWSAGNFLATAVETASGLPVRNMAGFLSQELCVAAGSAKRLAQRFGAGFAQKMVELEHIAAGTTARQEALLRWLEYTPEHNWRVKPGVEPPVQIGQDGRAYLKATGGEAGGVFVHETENGDKTLLIATGTPDDPLYQHYHPLTGKVDASKGAFKPAPPDQTRVIRRRQVFIYRLENGLHLRDGARLRPLTPRERLDLYASGAHDALPPRFTARLPDGLSVHLHTQRHPAQVWGLRFASKDRPIVVAEVQNRLFKLAPSVTGGYRLDPLSAYTLQGYSPVRVAQDFEVWRIDGRRYRAQAQPDGLWLQRLKPAQEARFETYLKVKARLNAFGRNPPAQGMLDLSRVGDNAGEVLEQALNHPEVFGLDLRHNGLQRIPGWAGTLPRHYTLDLRCNPISQAEINRYLAASRDGMEPTILLDHGLTLRSQYLAPDTFRAIRVKMPDGSVSRIEPSEVSLIRRSGAEGRVTQAEYFQSDSKIYRIARQEGKLDQAVEMASGDLDYASIQQCMRSSTRVKRGGNTFSCLRRGQAANADENIEMQRQGAQRQERPASPDSPSGPDRPMSEQAPRQTDGAIGPARQRGMLDRLAYWGRRVGLLPIVPLPAAELPAQVQHWTSAELATVYRGFIQEPGAENFAGFLEGLTFTADAEIKSTSPVTRRRVGALLKEASRDAELRESVFREAAEGVGSCTDRSAITLNRMEELVLQHKAARGDLSQTDLLEAGRGVYRLSRVRYHAQEALKGSHDLITTMLSIEIALRDKLNLPGKTLFIDAEQYLASKSQITSILNLVLADERAANGANLRNFLAEWEPWRNNVERLKRSEVERVQAPFYEELERLEARTALPVGDPQYLNQENYLQRLEEVSHRREEALKQFYLDELETALDDLPGTSQVNEQAGRANEPETGDLDGSSESSY